MPMMFPMNWFFLAFFMPALFNMPLPKMTTYHSNEQKGEKYAVMMKKWMW